MKIRKGDMWSAWSTADLFLLASSSEVDESGRLAMRAGLALEAVRRFEDLDKALGLAVRNTTKSRLFGKYGLLVSEKWPAAKLGLFQTRVHDSEDARLDYLQHSAGNLCFWLLDKPRVLGRDVSVHLEFPKTKLPQDVVVQVIKMLPDEVTLWIPHE